jgi:hypothetical protein
MSLSHSLKSALLYALAAIAVLTSVSVFASQRDDRSAAPFVVVPPDRRASDALPPAAPALPPGADRLSPLTIEVLVQRQSGQGAPRAARQTITRTSTNIHIAANDGREWFFERNPLDSRRVAGFLVQHAQRSVVFYDESDLRNMVGITGWADVLTLGASNHARDQMKRTPESRTIHGIRCTRYVARNAEAQFDELWWSERLALPCAFTLIEPSGLTRLSVEGLRRVIDPGVLRRPHVRFPGYSSSDLADWLEGH